MVLNTRELKGVIFFVSVSINIFNTFGESVLVEVDQGWLSGKRQYLVTKDGTYYSFKGIPYANAPVGLLRFKEPQPPLRWDGVRNASEHGPVCPQTDLFTGKLVPCDENCLFLNVYTPKIDNVSLPVMFYIHGGAYQSGSGNVDNYGPDFLVRKGVVLVTINYRLGVLGFLCMDNKDVPGNAGLKDQLAALKWVKKNIHKFGGNSTNVTIFGESAGGASVGYHVMSPLSKGYFQRAISMSGTPYNDWSIPYKPATRAFTLGKILGYDTKNKTELLKFLQNMSTAELLNAKPTVLMMEELVNIPVKMCLFTPVYEKDFGQNIFMPKQTGLLLNCGVVNEVDFMCGYTDREALMLMPLIENSYLALYNRYAELLVPYEILLKCDSDTNLNISAKIREYFFKGQSINLATIREMVHYMSSATIQHNVQRFFRAFPNPGLNSRYFYKFSCYSKRNVYGTAGAKYGIYGAGHLEDLLYLFNPEYLNMTLEKNTTEYKMVELATTLFTNFAKFGDPTPKSSGYIVWPQFDEETLIYADINNTLTVSNSPNEEDMWFWSKIYRSVGIDY